MEAYPTLLQEWTRAGQGHVFRFWHELNDEQRAVLCKQTQSIDVTAVTSVYQKLSKKVSDVEEKKEVEVKPLPGVVTRANLKEEDEARWAQLGYEALAGGRVAVLLMAGGQGTRLGYNDPKGMYDVGLLSGKSLFQLQAERLLILQRLCEQVTGKASGSVVIPWYIMTSFVTDEATKLFFEKHSYFGLQASQFFFFNQALFPCVREDDGRILMSSKFEIAIAPNGNGGLWAALRSSGALLDMEQKGVTLVASYGVDNILAKLADPVFVGFTLEQQKPIACKVVSKTHPEERVGVLCLKDGKPSIIEYSEIDPDRAHAKDPKTGQLLFNAAHIILNNFTLDFIKQCVLPESNQLSQLPYHIAKKKIPCIDDSLQAHSTYVMGWKFELFFFDVFEFASSISALEVTRAHEFSPLKNSMESPSDNPQTCRQHLSELHKQWATRCGATFSPQTLPNQSQTEAPLFEISTSLSYFGEGIKPYLQEHTGSTPLYHGKTQNQSVQFFIRLSSPESLRPPSNSSYSMALAVQKWIKTCQLATSRFRQPKRCITTSTKGASISEKAVLGKWKGFQAPAWSVEEKLLSSNSPSRVSASDVKRIANLSYLHIEDHKVDSLTKDMDNILKSVAAMEEIDTSNVQPLLSILEDYTLKTRPDIVRSTTENSEDGPSLASTTSNQGQNTDEEWGYVETPEPKILDNASQKEMGFFVVPKQKQPWEEDTMEEEGDDVKPLREVQKRL